MGENPVWTAANAGAAANAGSVNQFLGSHSATLIFEGGTLQDQQPTGNSIYQSTETQWLAQLFATGDDQTAVGSVQVQVSTIGGSPITELIPAMTVSIYADAGGLPTGTSLGSNTVLSSYVYSSPFWVSVPLPVSNLTPSTFYHVVIEMVGSPTNYYVWQESTQGVGASTSDDGLSWDLATYGLMFRIFDQAGTGPLQFIYEDGGVRWTQLGYNGSNQLSSITEFTNGQVPGGSLTSTRTLTYTNGFLTGVN